MRRNIVVLEDNRDRQEAMRQVLEDRFDQFDCRLFDQPAAMIAFLDTHLPGTVLISLDHDLELREKEGRLIDPGTGREVADYLSSKTPVCPVVLHSTNSAAVAGMERVLREAGWPTCRVVPHDDLEWIRKDWFPSVRRAIVRPEQRATRTQG